MSKGNKTFYVDLAKVIEWEKYCDRTGRVVSRVIEIAMEEFMEKYK